MKQRDGNDKKDGMEMLERKSPVRSCNASDMSNLTQPRRKSANLTDKAIGITQSETQKKKKGVCGRVGKNAEQRIQGLWDNIK